MTDTATHSRLTDDSQLSNVNGMTNANIERTKAARAARSANARDRRLRAAASLLREHGWAVTPPTAPTRWLWVGRGAAAPIDDEPCGSCGSSEGDLYLTGDGRACASCTDPGALAYYHSGRS